MSHLNIDEIMKQAAPIFKRIIPQIWHLFSVSVFFYLFFLAYKPCWMYEYLSTADSNYYFNITMIFCILFVSMCFTRLLVFQLIKDSFCLNYLFYALWCFIEIFIASWFVALYLSLYFDELYFFSLGKSMGILFSICCYPVVIATLSIAIIGLKEKPVEGSQMIKFRDYSKRLKFTVDVNNILYIAAEENYLRIYYSEGLDVKNFQLRASMNSIQKIVSEAGLFRCQRSFFINPSHITSLKKDKLGNITADLDCGGASVRVSKKLYNDLSDLI